MSSRLRVDWPACRRRGFCSELLPEVVELDEWGYPLVTGEVPESLTRLAREAVRTCPTLALRLTDLPAAPPPGRHTKRFL
ncbi:MAG: ferredoxin [Nocardioidaceae bacterium]